MDTELKAVKEYIKQFKDPKECYKHSCKDTLEALEQIQANVKCIQAIFQDPNYLPALYLMGIHATISISSDEDNILEARFGVAEDESISASAESTG